MVAAGPALRGGLERILRSLPDPQSVVNPRARAPARAYLDDVPSPSRTIDLLLHELRSYPQWGQLTVAALALPPLLVGIAALPAALASLLLLALLLTAASVAVRVTGLQERRRDR